VTIANLALLPDWNSLDSVRRAHSDLELAAIVFFALLVVMEALAHNSTDDKRRHLFDTIGIWFFAIAVICELFAYRYGQRNDFLSASVISSLDIKAGDALDKASQAHDLAQSASNIAGPAKKKAERAEREADSFERKIEFADQHAADAESHLADALQRAVNAEKESLALKAQLANRTLSDDQIGEIKKRLKQFPGQPYTITAYWQSPESLAIANRVQTALVSAGWAYSDEGTKDMLLGGVVGVDIWTHPDADEKTKEAASALADALEREGLQAVSMQENPKSPKTNMISINVGAKR